MNQVTDLKESVLKKQVCFFKMLRSSSPLLFATSANQFQSSGKIWLKKEINQWKHSERMLPTLSGVPLSPEDQGLRGRCICATDEDRDVKETLRGERRTWNLLGVVGALVDRQFLFRSQSRGQEAANPNPWNHFLEFADAKRRLKISLADPYRAPAGRVLCPPQGYCHVLPSLSENPLHVFGECVFFFFFLPLTAHFTFQPLPLMVFAYSCMVY